MICKQCGDTKEIPRTLPWGGMAMSPCPACAPEEAFKSVVHWPVATEPSQPTPCTWREDWEGNWDTGCGSMYVLMDGKPAENSMNFCTYCGRPLEEVPYNPDQQE